MVQEMVPGLPSGGDEVLLKHIFRDAGSASGGAVFRIAIEI